MPLTNTACKNAKPRTKPYAHVWLERQPPRRTQPATCSDALFKHEKLNPEALLQGKALVAV